MGMRAATTYGPAFVVIVLVASALLVASAVISCTGMVGHTSRPEADGSDSGLATDASARDDAYTTDAVSDASVSTWGISPDGGHWSPGCPDLPPTLGAPCSTEALECEYGHAWWSVTCDTVVQCLQGAWSADPLAGASLCSSEPGPNALYCPPDQQAVTAGSTCPDAGIVCYYGEGANCACSPAFGGPTTTWVCVPGYGCPTTRPRLGSACAGSQDCSYEVCAYGEQCTDGVWHSSGLGC
jgi:hypothetical protein